MKLRVMSDVHTELSEDWDIPPAAERADFDVMVMAGDLMPRMERGVAWLRARVPDKPVIDIAGNHEAYGTDIDRTREKAKEAAAGTNVHVMENESLVIGGVRFLAATPWTEFALFGTPDIATISAAPAMNDYRKIRVRDYARGLRPLDTLARHDGTRRFIEAEVPRPHAGKAVAVTHHRPYRRGTAIGHEHDVLSAAFVSDLSDLIERCGPKLWAYGHTHRSDDTLFGTSGWFRAPKAVARTAGSDWRLGRTRNSTRHSPSRSERPIGSLAMARKAETKLLSRRRARASPASRTEPAPAERPRRDRRTTRAMITFASNSESRQGSFRRGDACHRLRTSTDGRIEGQTAGSAQASIYPNSRAASHD